MHLLFEKRLGGTLMRPIGHEWYKRGFWRYSTNPDTVKQYLDVPPEGAFGTQFFLPSSEEDGLYLIPDIEGTKAYLHRAITFERFLKTDFDFIIASVYSHERSYYELNKRFKPDAVRIRQFGNPMEACNFRLCRNLLNSTKNPVPPDINHVHYHPEFSFEDYYYTPPETHKVIKNFVNCFPSMVDAPLWDHYGRAMSDFTWKMHGIQGRDGLLLAKDVPKAMREASFIWQVKAQGDGYGFVIHNAYASGRPCIVKKHYYRGQTAEALLEDSVTCIDLDRGTIPENVEKIRHFSEPERHAEMCENAYNRFKEVVDFDKECMQIKNFLARCS